MNKNKKFLLLTVLAVFSLVLAACGFGGEKSDNSSSSDGSKDSGSKAKEINLAIASEPPSLNPGLAEDTTSSAILINVFEGLTVSDAEGKPTPGMAEKWEISPDKKTYTFHLRDAKWSNGDTVVAGDFEYAWKWALNPDNLSAYSSIFYPIKGAQAYHQNGGSADDVGIKAEDDKTLVVTLENPTPYFLELTGFKTYLPVNKKVTEANKQWYADAGENYVTNGPYKLSDWQHDASITLTKFEDYWDASNVDVDTVNIAMIEKEPTVATNFKSGSLDYIGAPFQTVDLNAIDGFKKDGSLRIKDQASIYWYKFNTKDKIMNNANIRKALALAIDRQKLIDNVTKGEQKPATGMIPVAVPNFTKDRGYFKDNDVAAAKAALEAGMKELGIKDAKDIKVNISFNTSEAHAAIAQYIQEEWSKKLGISSQLDNSEWQVYIDKLKTGDYQIGRMGWVADYLDPYTFLEQFDTAKNGNNQTGWENAEYKKLLDKAVAEVDEAKRLDYLKQAEAIIMTEFPVAPIYYYTNLSVVKKGIENLDPNPTGDIHLKYVKIK
ncbi:peptide ABC transporter substrate-binding protein [Lysinibacillus sp. CNPSo 3705]|uniref:peptide ABC transporter substrate-binding protein n=1 Tax=Lysinibacillus sp. CNPSo 3705 TaxID=3028148 RepID=UPI001046B3C2|nr:peptide ABC transporter substrate-binding protein [Lysinibacillus sp. CNPSo 3705]MDD1501168.1 peptide ABC transporter substrate-binding protein [Lysinibacillus sp. CNPSo 3705]